MSVVAIYLCLAGAVVAETVATIALAASESLTKLVPSAIAVIGFVAAFWLLAFPLRVMPTGHRPIHGRGLVLVQTDAGHAGAHRSGLHHDRRGRHECLLEIHDPIRRRV